MVICTNVDVTVESGNKCSSSHKTMIFKTIKNITPMVNKQKCFGNCINYFRDAIFELKALLLKWGVWSRNTRVLFHISFKHFIYGGRCPLWNLGSIVWWHTSAITCQIIMLTCQIFMSYCQIFILTCISLCWLVTYSFVRKES